MESDRQLDPPYQEYVGPGQVVGQVTNDAKSRDPAQFLSSLKAPLPYPMPNPVDLARMVLRFRDYQGTPSEYPDVLPFDQGKTQDPEEEDTILVSSNKPKRRSTRWMQNSSWDCMLSVLKHRFSISANGFA